jgi:prepilin-type processing-associated H-X9-DG protein
MKGEHGSGRAGLARMGLLAGVLAAGLVAVAASYPLLSTADEGKALPKGDMPADLARVPGDSAAFVSVRVGDLWSHQAAKGLREKVAKDHREALEQWQKVVGVPVEDVERLTLVFADLVPQSEPIPLAFVATGKPFDKEKVLAAVAPGAKEERRKDQTLYVGGKEPERGVCFISDRAYVTSTADEIRSFLERPRKEGDQGTTLRLAAEKHALVIGVSPQPFITQAGERLEEEAGPFKPLLKTESATLVADLGEAARGQARLVYTSEKNAREAEQAVKTCLAMGREAIARIIEEMGREKDALTSLAQLLKQFQGGLKDATVEQKGASVELAMHFKPDLSAGGLAVVELVERVEGSSARIQSQNNLKQIALAMINYADSVGHLPAQAVFGADGKPLLSWRVMILPYIEQDALYREFHLDEPWDSEHNKKLLARMPKIYEMPGSPKGTTDTFYQCFVGPGAFFEGKKGVKFPADFTDGTSNTIMCVEAAKGVPWTKPEDLPFDPEKELPKLGGQFPGGFNVSMCDGSVHFLNNKISKETLKAAITRNGGEVLGSDF